MSFAFMPLYTGDYLRDTQHLSCSEHGIYFKLLMYCWDQRGPAPVDERKLCGIVNARSSDEIEALRRVLTDFFTRMEDGWYNHRMDREVQRAAALSERLSTAGAKGGRKRKSLDRQGIEAKAKPELSNGQAKAKPLPHTITTTTITTTTPKTKEKDQEAASGATTIWTFGIEVLTSNSKISESSARSFIAMQRRKWDDETIMEALQASLGKEDPKAYLVKVLKSKPTAVELAAMPKNGDKRVRATGEEFFCDGVWCV